MAPEPPHRLILNKLIDALTETALKMAQDETKEKRSIGVSGYVIHTLRHWYQRAIVQVCVHHTILTVWFCRVPGSSIEVRLMSLRKDLDMLQVAVKLLMNQQAILERLKAAAHNVVQPILCMPDEILSNIFEFGSPGAYNLWTVERPTSTIAAWTPAEYDQQRKSIGATCSRFRTTLIHTPRCWSYVSCVMSTSDERTSTSLVTLKARLARSGDCPIDLRMELTTGERPLSTYAREAISRVFLPHMHRCRSLRLVSDNRLADFPLLVAKDPEIPLRGLRHIAFDWDPAMMQGSDEPDPPEGATAEESMLSLIASVGTTLESLTIVDLIKTQGNFGTINGQALTQLKLDIPSTGTALQLLQRCTSLKYLHWQVNQEEEVIEDRPIHIDFNHLVSLRVSGSYTSNEICTITAPLLEQARFLPDPGSTHMPFDILRPNHPLLPSLTRVHVSLRHNKILPSFLRRHPRLIECIVGVGQLTGDDDVASIRGLLDSLLPDSSRGYHPSMEHLTFAIVVMDGAYWAQVEPSVELVLEELPMLRIDLRFLLGDDVSDSFSERMGSRFSSGRPDTPRLGETWRDAWGDYPLW